jgi:integrase
VAHIERRSTKSGRRYEVRWRPAPGESERSRSFPTYEAAQAWKVQVEAAVLHGHRLDPRSGRQKFGDYAEAWLASRALADRTRELYRHQLNAHVLPAFSDVGLSQITAERVRRWYRTLDAKGGLVAAKCYRLLRSILATAVEDGLISRNPCIIKRAGVEDSPDRPYVPPELVISLAAVADEHLKAMILVAAFGGLRLGELRALKIADFDEARGTLTVSASVDNAGRRKEPKSNAGRRTVALPPAIVTVLRDHVDSIAAAGTGPLFPGPMGGLMSPAFHQKGWTKAKDAVGQPDLHFHDLRHTAGTLSAQAGATVRELMARLGHSSPRAAMRYQHAANERDREIARRMGEMLNGLASPDSPRDTRGIETPTEPGRTTA